VVRTPDGLTAFGPGAQIVCVVTIVASAMVLALRRAAYEEGIGI